MKRLVMVFTAIPLLATSLLALTASGSAQSDGRVQLQRIAQDDRVERRENKADRKAEKREEKRERKRHKHHRKHHKGQI